MTNHDVIEFDSLSDFIAYAERPSDLADRDRASRNPDSVLDYLGAAWTGVPSWDEAINLAFGWREGAAKVEKMRASFAKGAKITKERVVSPVGVGSIHLGRFIQGHPVQVRTTRKAQEIRDGKGKIVRILVNIGSACTVCPATTCSSSVAVNSEAIIARGAAVLSLVKALEAAGKRCEITVAAHIGTPAAPEYRITVKRPSQPLNLISMAFAVAHPAMLRRIVFSAYETEAREIRRAAGADAERYTSGAYVGRFRTRPDFGSVFEVDPSGYHLYLRSMQGSGFTAGEAQRIVREAAAEHGVKIAG